MSDIEKDPQGDTPSINASQRMATLGSLMQRGKLNESDAKELYASVELAHAETTYLQLVAVVLSGMDGASMKPGHATLQCLTTLLSEKFPTLARCAAAQALERLGKIPEAAVAVLCDMLFDKEEAVRETALSALTTVVVVAAPYIGSAVSAKAGSAWTTASAIALARSAGDWPNRQQSVVLFLRHGLVGGAPAAAAIAGFVVLAHSQRDCGAVAAIAELAVNESKSDDAKAALTALAQLGPLASKAIPVLTGAMPTALRPEHEVLLCQTAMKIIKEPTDIPAVTAMAIERVQVASDVAAAAHCLWLSTHAPGSEEAVIAVKARFGTASDGLKPVLQQTFRAISGQELSA